MGTNDDLSSGGVRKRGKEVDGGIIDKGSEEDVNKESVVGFLVIFLERYKK